MIDLASYLKLPESARFDRKERLLVVENATDPEHAEHLKDFVRHVVALANFSRLSGRHSVLMFGVDDAKHVGGIKPANGIGILNQSAISSDPVLWPIEDDSAVEVYWQEHVQDPYEKIIRRWIGPRTRPPSKGADWQSELQHHLERVPIDAALVAALVIKPTLSEEPFFVRDHRDLGLETRHFVRVNDNSVPVGETDAKRLLTKWTDAPYLPPAVWRKYLELLRAEVSDVFPRDPNTPDVFQEIYVEPLSGNEPIRFQELWKKLTDSRMGSSQFVVFFGEPGTGKTSCLKRGVFEQAAVTLTELDNDDELLEPQSWIPVYVSLDSYDGSEDPALVVANRISEVLAKSGERETAVDARLLSARGLRFIVAIDAVDEIPKVNIQDSARKIDGFAKKHVTSNHAITSRETRCPSRWKGMRSTYRVRLLSPIQVWSYLGSRLTEEQLKSPRLALLLDELASMLSVPRLLHAFSLYLEQSPEPSAGMAVLAVLEAIWAREERLFRGWSGSFDHYRVLLRDYAIRCLELNIDGLYQDENHGLPEDDLLWLQNAGLLRLSGGWPHQIGFAHLEYLDNIVAQTLLLTGTRPSPTYQQLRERIAVLLAKQPDRQLRTIRYLINMVEADISSLPWSEWLRVLPDPTSRLRVIAERRRPEFGDIALLGEVVSNLDEAPIDRDRIVYWLGELLEDANPEVVECVLKRVDRSFISSLEEHITSIVDRADNHELRLLAAKRLLETQLAIDRDEMHTAIISWLQDHREPGHVEDALTLVGSFGLTWASEYVYDVATADHLPYPFELRFSAAKVLSQLGDPRGIPLVELVDRSRHTSIAETVVDDFREENFETTLSKITSEPSGAEEQTIS